MLSKNRMYLKTIATMGLIASGCATQIAFASSDVPPGFAHNTTGGAGGEVVTVSTRTQLQHELCHSLNSAGGCGDNAPRTIIVSGTIDFRGQEGTASGLGCHPYANKAESLVLLNGSDTHCNGFPKSQITYDKVGDDPMLVGSNKTIISKDGKGVIEGRGLRLVQVKNVIIRNLTIQDINPSVIFAGDAIALDTVDNVWIDHNKFFMLGRQMIAAGFGPVTHMTVSWNDMDGNTPYASGGDGHHYWNLLLESTDQSVTLAYNWIHDFAGRAPIIMADGTTGRVNFQIVNNYFQGGTWHALNAYSGVNVLVEGNYYDQVNTPILQNTSRADVGSVFALIDGTPNPAAQQACKQELGRKCGTNFLANVPTTTGFDQSETVLQTFNSLLHTEKLVKPVKASAVPTLIKAQAGPGHI